VRQILRGNALAGVGHSQHGGVVRKARANVNFAVWLIVENGVAGKWGGCYILSREMF